jgi:hypothetical protein
LRITPDDLDGGAVQIVADDRQLAPDQLGLEALDRVDATADEARVIGDAVGSHDQTITKSCVRAILRPRMICAIVVA